MVQYSYTGADLIAALEMNGYRQVRGHYVTLRYIGVDDHQEQVIVGCAIGQLALNLGLEYADASLLLNQVGINPSHVISLNDSLRYGIRRIAKTLREESPDALTKIATLNRPDNHNPYANSLAYRDKYQGVKVLPIEQRKPGETVKVPVPTLYRDSLGRFAPKPITPAIKYHNKRDASGRFSR